MKDIRSFQAETGADLYAIEQNPLPCAARIGKNDCEHNRAPNSLFCTRHKHACDRIYLATRVTHEQLDYMIQRDRLTKDE